MIEKYLSLLLWRLPEGHSYILVGPRSGGVIRGWV
jgi:hypothetical protein